MIVDMVENLHDYKMLSTKLTNGLDKLAKVEIEYEKHFIFDGGFLFFQKGSTKPINEGTFEAHKKYLDVQIVLDGSEYVAWTPIKQLTVATDYDSVKDVVRLDGKPKTIIQMKKGMGYLCFPHDGHKALRHVGTKLEYKKAIIKIEL